jgi:hypothetical protein
MQTNEFSVLKSAIIPLDQERLDITEMVNFHLGYRKRAQGGQFGAKVFILNEFIASFYDVIGRG